MEMLSLDEITKKAVYSEEDIQCIRASLKEEIDRSDVKIVVLDDDPTGVQAVHGIHVYTDWSCESIQEGFESDEAMFFVLTNSRAMTESETKKVHKEIAENIIEAGRLTGKPYVIISRGDSTLRGHYPLETQTLRETLEKKGRTKVHGEIIVPFFYAGGRITVDNVHYVRTPNGFVPAAETEFARDKTFGYKSSDLGAYIEEKTGGLYRADDVRSVSLKQLSEKNYESIEKTLTSVKEFEKVIVNAVHPVQLEVFSVAVYRAIDKGQQFLFRTAADFVKAFGGIGDKALLTKNDMICNEWGQGGLVIIGSHTQKTTEQLNCLRELQNLIMIEFNSDLVLEGRLDEEVALVNRLSRRHIEAGKTVVIYTKRQLLTLENDTREQALKRSVAISEAVQQLVAKVGTVPAFVVAKGGITSSDIGVKALKVRKARVMGQIQPGVPVWQTDEDSLFPKMPYIIFPGNVGEEDTLKKVVEEMTKG